MHRELPPTFPSDPVGLGWLRLAAATAVLAAMLIGPVALVRAANTLSDPSVTPGAGTTAQTFTFSVRYVSTSPPRPPTAIWADVAGLTIPLSPSGSATNSVYTGTSTLPVGTWAVTFEADVSTGDPDPLAGPSVVVTAPPQPTPTPPPPPTPPPTPTPVPPTPRPTPTPTLPPGATPRPPTPRPTPTATLRPGQTPRATPTRPPGTMPASTPEGSPASSAEGSASQRASPSGTHEGATASPSASAGDSAAPEPVAAEGDDQRGFVSTPWLVLGGGLSAAGAGVIVLHWVAKGRRPGSAL